MPPALLLSLALLLGACALPEFMAPYRIDIQQGNHVTQEMVAQLKAGMSKEQVRFVLGTPLLVDIFHAERWDYIYTRETTEGKREKRKLVIFFEDGRLARIDGDEMLRPTSAAGR